MRYVPCVSVQATRPVFYFIHSKARHLFHKKRNPRVICWTQLYRKQHKKGTEEQAKRARKRKAKKVERGIAGVSLEFIQAQKNQSQQQRNKLRAAAKTVEKEAKKKTAQKKAEQKAKQEQLKKTSELKQKKAAVPKVQTTTAPKKQTTIRR
jgi:large subunit ribosomal protein L24e